MPKIQTYDIYLIPAAGATKTYSATDVLDVYELNATGGAITLLADMTFAYSGTPVIGSEFKFQYGGGVTSNTAGGTVVSIFGTNLTNSQALSPLVITAFWNGTAWEIMIVKDTKDNLVSVTSFGSTPNINALTIATGGILSMQPASATFGGGVSTTTQTFAGAKTFDILSGNFSIDANGIGIGGAPNSRTFINAVKTFTSPLITTASDSTLSLIGTFSYSNTNTATSSATINLRSLARVTGVYTPQVLHATYNAIGNQMSAELSKTFVCRSSYIFESTGNASNFFNANFIASTASEKLLGTESCSMTSNYDFYSSVPYSGHAAPFTITNQFGFYCDDYKVASKIPAISSIGGDTEVSATITNSWQIYMSGSNLTTIGSYIGNRLGIGFATQPTTNSQVTALLHIGAGTLASAQMRLVAGVAPTTPNDGDVWLESNTNTGLKVRIAGVTKTVSLV